jgi:hypothetical protein
MNLPRPGWIESPKYDLWLLSLPPLLGLLICTFAWRFDPVVISGASLFILGMPHYLSTYSFYLDDKNMAYAKTRKAAFFIGPLLIVLLLTAGLKFKFYLLIAIWVDAWNVFHVSRQSAGILSVYRHLNGGDNRLEKLPANLALIGISAGLYSMGIDRQQSFSHYLSMLPWDVAPYIGPGLLLLGFGGLVVLMVRMSRRSINILSPEMLFLATSALLFLPYVVLEKRSTATSAMLAGHYLQYMGILWLLNHRKYKEVVGSSRQRALAWISTSWPRILGLLASLVIATSISDRLIHHYNPTLGFHNWLLNLVVLMHFYLDGLFWAFKYKHTRDSIGPYLILPEHRVAAPLTIAPGMPVPVPAG